MNEQLEIQFLKNKIDILVQHMADFYARIHLLEEYNKKNPMNDTKKIIVWIPIDLEEPPKDIPILLANHKQIEIGYWIGNNFGFYIPNLSLLHFPATHWAPLPHPPLPT